MKRDNSEIIKLLTDLDLSYAEAQTYNALLYLESISIRKIAAATGINRGTTYEALKRLVALGLVSVKRRGKREQYTAETPEKIYDIIREKRRDLLDASALAKHVVPDLLAQTSRNEGRPVVRYYEDDEGVAAILKDVLQTCRTLPDPEYYAYSSGPVRQYLYRKYPQFTDRRIAEGIRVKVIAVGLGGEEAAHSERKWLPDINEGDTSSYTIIYGAKVATISIAADLTPYGVVIKDAGAANMQRLLFEKLWRTL